MCCQTKTNIKTYFSPNLPVLSPFHLYLHLKHKVTYIQNIWFLSTEMKNPFSNYTVKCCKKITHKLSNTSWPKDEFSVQS